MDHVSEEDFARVMTKLETFLDATITLDPPGPGTITNGESNSDAGSPVFQLNDNPPELDEVLAELVETGSITRGQAHRLIESIKPALEDAAKYKSLQH